MLEHVRRHGTRWVVLGGDSLPGGKGLVPDRDTRHAIQGGRLRYDDIPTDLYYVTEGSWDHDGDGVYGDWRADRRPRCRPRRFRPTPLAGGPPATR